MFLIRMALRNILRHKLRTGLSALVVLSGVWVLIVGQGFIGGLSENVIRASVDSMAGHISIRPTEYPDAGFKHPVDGLFPVTPELVEEIDGVSTAWTTRTYAMADAISHPNTLRVRLVGFDPERDPLVFPRNGWKVVGELPDENSLMVSTGVAKLFELEVGDVLVLKLRTVAGEFNALMLPVSGIYSVGNPALDSMGVFLQQGLLGKLIMSDRVSHLSFRVRHRDQAEKVAAGLRTKLKTFGGFAPPGENARENSPPVETTLDTHVEVVTWVDATRELLELQQIRQKSLNFLVFILLGIAGLGIANTILMAAFERMREIGTLRAMGMRRRKVLAMFLLEGAFIGVIGGFLGAVLGAALIYNYSVNPIDMTPMIEGKGAENFPISTLLYTEFSVPMAVGSFIFGVVVSVLASIYPSVLATRMAPADAVRAE